MPTTALRYHIDAHRSAASQFGAACSLVKGPDGEPMHFESYESARNWADALNNRQTPNCSYVAHRNPRPVDRPEEPFDPYADKDAGLSCCNGCGCSTPGCTA